MPYQYNLEIFLQKQNSMCDGLDRLDAYIRNWARLDGYFFKLGSTRLDWLIKNLGSTRFDLMVYIINKARLDLSSQGSVHL